MTLKDGDEDAFVLVVTKIVAYDRVDFIFIVV